MQVRVALWSKAKDVGAIAGSRILRQIVMLVVMATAARLLGKELLGIWALIYVVIQFGVLVSDTGISTFIVRHRDLSARMFASAFYLGLLVAIVMSLAMGLICVPILPRFGIGQYTPHFLTSTLVIVALTATGLLQAKLRRERRFLSMLWSDVGSSLIMLIGSVWMLVAGAGLWSFIVPTIVSTMGGFAICAGVLGIPAPRLDRRDAREIMDYALGLVGFSSVYFWARNADQLLVGRFMGAAPLGVYSLAVRIMMMPLSQVNATAQTVALPYLSPHQDNAPRLRASIRTLTVSIGLLTTLPMIWVWLERDLLVRILLGDDWGGVAKLLAVLAPLAVLQSLVNPVGMCYQVRGKTKLFFWIGLLHTSVTLIAFAAGVWTGSLTWVVVFYALANVFMAPISVGQGLRTIDGRFRDWLVWTAPLFACLPLCWTIWSVTPKVESQWLQALLTIAFTTLGASPLYMYVFRNTFGRIHLSPLTHRVTAPSALNVR